MSRNKSLHLSNKQWSVLIWDCQSSRQKLVERAVLACDAQHLLIERLTDIDVLEYTSFSCIAIVALESHSMEGSLGLEIIRRLKKNGFSVISYVQDADSLEIGLRCRVLLAGAICMLDSGKKEFPENLQCILNSLLSQKAHEQEETQRIKDFMRPLGIVGESEAMLSIFQRVIRISTLSDLPVLVTGESGTGKELIARAIHQLDPKRCASPFVAVNCGAISPGLAESILFGHRKGSFTGADHEHKGFFRAAQGGVIFLDEIGELSSELQAKLLRILQEKRVLSVGDDHEVDIDFRLVAATNQDLEKMVQQHMFRGDLLHRLKVLAVHICPLRERTADIQPLIHHFLIKYQSLRSADNLHTSKDFIDALVRLKLPGNIRQLENIVRYVLVNKIDNAPLGLSDLSTEIWEELCIHEKKCLPQTESGLAEHGAMSTDSQIPMEFCAYLNQLLDSNRWHLTQVLDHCERLLLEIALHRAHGNQSETAQLLGITPRSVYNKLTKHHIGH